VVEGGRRFTAGRLSAGLAEGLLAARASPPRTAGAAGEVTAVAAGRRTAVRTVEPRGSSL